jgi:crossover junction endodeoxyribonuclease RuvC
LDKKINERPLVLGVDPGYSGAFALYNLDSGALIEVMDMPTKSYTQASGKQKKHINLTEVAFFLDINRDLIRGAIIEEVGAAPDQGVVSMFNFGFSTGAVHGLIAANLIPIITVRPTVWKTNLGLSSNKTQSLERAKVEFPNLITKFLRKKDDGRAEAALLAKYGERIFGVKKHKSLI